MIEQKYKEYIKLKQEVKIYSEMIKGLEGIKKSKKEVKLLEGYKNKLELIKPDFNELIKYLKSNSGIKTVKEI